MRQLLTFARFDFVWRVRKLPFWLMLAAALISSYVFVAWEYSPVLLTGVAVPPLSSLGHPSWIPMANSFITSIWLSIAGFFFVRGSIENDENTGMDIWIHSTKTPKGYYLLGKFVSYVAQLFCIILAVVIGSFVIAAVCFPGQHIAGYSFISPFIALLPMALYISVLAIFFESSYILRGTVGAVTYAILASALLGIYLNVVFTAEYNGVLYVLSPFGNNVTQNTLLDQEMLRETQQPFVSFILSFFEPYVTGTINGFSDFFHGIVFNGIALASIQGNAANELIKFFLSACLLGASVYMYRNPNYIALLPKRKTTRHERQYTKKLTLDSIVYSPCEKKAKLRFIRGIAAEIKFMLSRMSRARLRVCITCIALGIMLPLEQFLPLLLLCFVRAFSCMGSREHTCDTLKNIAVLPSGISRQIVYSWLSGIVLALVIVSTTILKVSLTQQYTGVFALISIAVFIPSLAIFLGEWTKTSRIFEIALSVMASVTFFLPIAELKLLSVLPAYISIPRAYFFLISGLGMGIAAIVKRNRCSYR